MQSKPNKKLLSPRGYLSHTQISMFESDPEKYRQKYILGNEQDNENDFMSLGKMIATSLETGESTGDLVTDATIAQLVVYKNVEHEMTAIFNTDDGEITLLGKLDTFEDTPSIKFREYKSGSVRWSQTRAQNHPQNMQYATMIWLNYKKLPSEAWLDWIPTIREQDGVVRVSGEPIQSYKLTIGLTQVLEYMARVKKVAVAIDKMYRQELGI